MTPSASAAVGSTRSASATSKADTSATPVTFDSFLAKLAAKDRLNVERHLAAVGETPSGKAHVDLYQRLVRTMATLAPLPAKTNGQQSLQFYVPDGKYRMQVFALEDLRAGQITVYVSDALDAAVAAKIVMPASAAAKDDEPGPKGYRVGKTKELIEVERLNGKSAGTPAPFYKDMLGWNRSALKIVLPVNASTAQIDAVEGILATAAKRWEGK